MFEPTKLQMAAVERLSLKAQTVAVTPPEAEGAPITVEVIGIPEPMGFTTRAPRRSDLTINADGHIAFGFNR